MNTGKTAYYQDEMVRRQIERARELHPNWKPRTAPDQHQVKEYVLERMFGVMLTPEGCAA